MHSDPRRRRWSMLALLFAARVGLGLQFQTVASVADPLVERLHVDFASVGLLIGLFMLSGIVLSIPAGLAGRWLTDRRLVVIGLACLSLGGLLSALADGFALLAAGRLLAGAGFVLSTLYFTKMAADWFAGREIATAMAVLVMSWPFGIALGQVLHGWLALHWSWQAPFIVASAYGLLAMLGIGLAYRPPADQASDGAAAAAASTALTGREWRLVLIAALAWASFNAAYVIYLSFAPRVLTAGGLSPLQAAATISLASWVMIVSGAACGQIADRTGRSGLVLTVCLASAMALLALLPNVSWSVPLSLGFGLLGMAPAGLIMALAGTAMAPHKRAFGMGVFFSIYFVLMAPAPAIAGWLYDRTGDAFAAIVLAIALFGVTLLSCVAYRMAERRPR